MRDSNKRHLLTRYRQEKGTDALKRLWDKTISENPKKAIEWLNDRELDYATFYFLYKKIDERSFSHILPSRQLAVEHIRSVLNDDSLEQPAASQTSPDATELASTLQWIVATGRNELLDRRYVQTVDQAFIQSLLVFRQDVLKEAVDTVFLRKRNEVHSHYLTWAVYQCGRPSQLKYVADYLLSQYKSDVQLARKWLRFVPEVTRTANNTDAYRKFSGWYEKNAPYLLTTGETNDSSPEPRPFTVCHTSKYIGREADDLHKKNRPMDRPEIERIELFHRLSEDNQQQLAEASWHLRQMNRESWQSWLKQPIKEQLQSLHRNNMGGLF